MRICRVWKASISRSRSELNNTINSKGSEIANLDSMIQEAARVAVEASQAKAAAEQKAAEEAAKAESGE